MTEDDERYQEEEEFMEFLKLKFQKEFKRYREFLKEKTEKQFELERTEIKKTLDKISVDDLLKKT